MQLAWDEILRLTRINALHKRGGWKLGEIGKFRELKDAAGELLELAAAEIECVGPSQVDDSLVMGELADVFGCLIGYAVKRGWTCQQVEAALLRKLKERFEGGA